MPVNEFNLLAFIGWLSDEKDAGRRAVTPASLAQYFSAVRGMHQAMMDASLSAMPVVAVASRAYGHWYEEGQVSNHIWVCPPQSCRPFGDRDWTLSHIGIGSQPPALVCAFALGLRESSALSLLTSEVPLSTDELVVQLSVSKGAIVRDLPPAVYRRVSTALPSPLALFAAWRLRSAQRGP
jgi:hypothetical protein